MPPNPHPAIERLSFLLGTWQGEGHGDYPTIDGFDYVETVVFEHFGKPFLAYTQRTRGVDGAPLHAESGYLRPIEDGTLELIIAQPTGVVEIHNGSQNGQSLSFESASIGLSPTAKKIERVGRRIAVADEQMTNELHMSAVGQPYQWHLSATLTQTG